FKLVDLTEACLFHKRSCFFTTNPACAECDDWHVFSFFWQSSDGFWKVAEVVDTNRDGVVKCPDAHFIIVARIEQ
ncbi:MAG: hypothetical protein L3J63_02265, partial [Geopsychrobacter sp.]|nr:hypothetical protein [Geopsychrobacter sp.]